MLLIEETSAPPDAPYEIESFDTEKKWLEARQRGVGGSDIPVVLGLARWSSPFELWALKTGKVQPEMSRLRLDVGRELEGIIARNTLAAYPDREEAELPNRFTILRSKEQPWRQFSPDFVMVPKGQTLVKLEPAAVTLCEFKTANALQREDWDSQPAKTASVQTQWGLSITGWTQAVITALIGLGDELLTYDQPAHPALQGVIVEAAERFWEHVRSDVPPDTDATKATARALAAMFPKDSGETIQLDPERFGSVLSAWRVAKAERTAVEARVSAAENELKAAIGSAARAEIPGFGALTLKTTERKAYEVKASSYRQLRDAK